MSDNRLLLAQSRRAMREHIAQSPTVVTLKRYTTKDDGMGNKIIDQSTSVTKTFTIRISRERAVVQEAGPAPSGVDTSMSMYALAPWDVDLREGDSIGSWRVGRVVPLRKFGGVQALEAVLITQTNAGVEYVPPAP